MDRIIRRNEDFTHPPKQLGFYEEKIVPCTIFNQCSAQLEDRLRLRNA